MRARRRELADLDAELRILVDRSAQLDPADCATTDVCHMLAPPAANDVAVRYNPPAGQRG